MIPHFFLGVSWCSCLGVSGAVPDCTSREPGCEPALGTDLLKAVYKQGLSLCMLLPFCLGYKYVPYMPASLSFAISMENPVKQLSCCLLSNQLQMHVSFPIINRYEIVFMQCASLCHWQCKQGKLRKKNHPESWCSDGTPWMLLWKEIYKQNVRPRHNELTATGVEKKAELLVCP